MEPVPGGREAPPDGRRPPAAGRRPGPLPGYDTDMEGDSKNLELNCPCCGTLMIVDPATGVILRSEQPRKGVASFGELLKEVGASRQKTETKLQRALEEQRQREEILRKRFKEAVRKAEESDEKPAPRPIDLD